MKIFFILCILCIVGLGFYLWKKEGAKIMPSAPFGLSGSKASLDQKEVGDGSFQYLLRASNSGTYVQVWENIMKYEQDILNDAASGKRVSDALDKYDTLIPLYFVCKMTSTESEDTLRTNIEKYIQLVARNKEDPEYESYMRFVAGQISMKELYAEVIAVYEASTKEFPEYADEARRVIRVLEARLNGNFGTCTYTEEGIQI